MCGAMRKKSFTFGMGTGILAMTVVFFFTYNAVRTQWEEERNELILAKDTAAAVSQETTLPRIGMTELEAIDYAESLGMVFPESADATMMPSETPVPSETTNDIVQPKLEPEPTLEPPPTPEPSQEPESPAVTDADGWITFSIPEGLVARQVCELLEAEGVIEDADDFGRYLMEQGLTTKLAHGTYRVPQNCTYGELLTYWKYVE